MSDPDDGAPRRDRTLTWWPFAAALVVGGLLLTIVFVVGSDADQGTGTKRDSSGALTCPVSYRYDADAYWVPSDASGVDGDAALVPDTAPTHATVCRYVVDASRAKRPAPLAGHRTLRDGLMRLASELAPLKRVPDGHSYSFQTGIRQVVYLVALTYPTGFVWVATDQDRVGASNGGFETYENVFTDVDRAYRTRAWPS